MYVGIWEQGCWRLAAQSCYAHCAGRDDMLCLWQVNGRVDADAAIVCQWAAQHCIVINY
jgi:hypothetical protein